jgi:hypothetical protein
MYARVATFQGDPSEADQAIEFVRGQQEADRPPPGLEMAKGMMMLIDRQNGKGLGITLFESEEDRRRGDEALNAMNPPGSSGRRVSVDFYEVPVQRMT